MAVNGVVNGNMMVPDDIYSAFVQRFVSIQQNQQDSNKLIHDLITHIKQTEEVYSHEIARLTTDLNNTKLDFEDSTKSRRDLQQKLGALEAEYKQSVLRNDLLQKRHPYILILIDGDGLIFQDQYLGQGLEGGKQAAYALRAAVLQEYQRLVGASGEKDVQVVAKICANAQGLSRALRRSGSSCSETEFRDFTLGFTQCRATFDFIDVGYGKERADSKITETARFHLQNVNCKMVALGISHDAGYAPFLDEILSDSEARQRILVLEGTPTVREIVATKVNIVNLCDTLFRSDKLANSNGLYGGNGSYGGNGAGSGNGSYVGNGAGSGNGSYGGNGADSGNYGSYGGYGGPGDQNGNANGSVNGGSARGPAGEAEQSHSHGDVGGGGALLERSETPSTTTTSSSVSSVVEFTIVKQSKKKAAAAAATAAGPTPGPAPSYAGVSAHPATPPPTVALPSHTAKQLQTKRAAVAAKKQTQLQVLQWNPGPRGLDPPIQYNPDVVDAVKRRTGPNKFCNNHVLRPPCAKGSLCGFDHTTVPTAEVRAALAYLARLSPCTEGQNCHIDNCIYGHHCPSVRNGLCTHPSCRFPPEMHPPGTKFR